MATTISPRNSGSIVSITGNWLQRSTGSAQHGLHNQLTRVPCFLVFTPHIHHTGVSSNGGALEDTTLELEAIAEIRSLRTSVGRGQFGQERCVCPMPTNFLLLQALVGQLRIRCRYMKLPDKQPLICIFLTNYCSATAQNIDILKRYCYSVTGQDII